MAQRMKGEIMGTNYYYRMTKFRRLGWDVEERQIGKKSSGWQFCFRAHKGEDGKIEIGSWKDWKEVLTRKKAGKIYDEYGEEWSAREFIAMVEASKDGKNHGEYCGFADGTWNDAEGWSFSLKEFC
jgi:hypothetical protein